MIFSSSCNKEEIDSNLHETVIINNQVNTVEAGFFKRVLQWVGLIPKVDVFFQHGFYEDNAYGYQCNAGDAICMVHVIVENYEPEVDETKAELMRIYDEDNKAEFLAAVIKKDDLSHFLIENIYNNFELYMPYDLSIAPEINDKLGFKNDFIIKQGKYLINTEFDDQGVEYFTIVF